MSGHNKANVRNSCFIMPGLLLWMNCGFNIMILKQKSKVKGILSSTSKSHSGSIGWEVNALGFFGCGRDIFTCKYHAKLISNVRDALKKC